jgi:hypothetical protein
MEATPMKKKCRTVKVVPSNTVIIGLKVSKRIRYFISMAYFNQANGYVKRPITQAWSSRNSFISSQIHTYS